MRLGDADPLGPHILYVLYSRSHENRQEWGALAEPAISEASRAQWTGFVKLICDAYFERRVASYPLDRLQLELTARGRIERRDVVAEWSRLVYETLHQVAPQFPRS